MEGTVSTAFFEPLAKDFRGRKATLVGLGARTHVALARALVAAGADVTISDAKPREKLRLEIALLGDMPVRLSLGGHKLQDIDGADIVFVSPGVPQELGLLVEARRRGIPISSEIELLFRYCPAFTVGITGSSGKTTTTTLVGEMLRASGYRVFVGGNIGIPLIDRLSEMSTRDRVVLELSSFQLETMVQSPRVACVLNVTPNHLDRHVTFEAYAAAKRNIVKHQDAGDDCVLGVDDPEARSWMGSCPARESYFSAVGEVTRGALLRDGVLTLRLDGPDRAICTKGEIKLRGEHNALNSLAASLVASLAGATVEAERKVLTSFGGVEHRLEFVRDLDGVKYFNDSIATSPERAIAALSSFEEPIVLIACGKSKHLPVDGLARKMLAKVKAAALTGEFGAELAAAMTEIDPAGRVPVRVCDSLSDAVQAARSLAKPGDVVVMSPGGTSFDAFRDFEERGRAFKSIVGDLV